MSEYNVAGIPPAPASTGTPIMAQPNGSNQVVDNRLRLLVDPKQIEFWEMELIENPQVRTEHMLILFSRYAANASGLISPGLPNAAIDELTDAQMIEIKTSEAYRRLRHEKITTLRAAMKSFQDQAVAALESPN